MEEKVIALKADLANHLSKLVYDHNLPVHINFGRPIEHLRSIVLTYDIQDELLIEWLLAKIEQENIYL